MERDVKEIEKRSFFRALAADVMDQLQKNPQQIAVAENERWGVRLIGKVTHPMFPCLTPGGKPRVRVLVKKLAKKEEIMEHDMGSYVMSIEAW